MRLRIIPTLFIIFSFLIIQPAKALTSFEVSTIYSKLSGFSRPAYDVFEKGLEGFQKLKEEGKIAENEVLTIIDFRLPSSEKRMWIIDMKDLQVIHNTYVSHGRNSGTKYAKKFSNRSGSFQSSLGFYITAETYHGKHGLSLRLDGQEKGFNNNARSRAIVLHSAQYASADFVKEYGRLGRSLGCPAIPPKNFKKVINDIKDGTAVFIYYPEEKYLQSSKYINSFV